MASSVESSKALAKLKKRGGKHWKKSRDTEPKAKGQQLPGGITHGIAKLVKAALDVTKKGQNAGSPFVTFTGIVTEPEEFAGSRASIFNYFNESEFKTEEKRFDEFCSNLQLLGVDTSGMEMDDIPKILKQLQEDKPEFLFNTWKPEKRKNNDPEPNTQVFIQGLADEKSLDDDDDDNDDEDTDDEDDEEEEKPRRKKKASSSRRKSDDDEDDDEDDEDSSDDDGDEDEDEEDAADDEDEDEEDDKEETIPERGEVFNYKVSPKGKAVPHEVTAVNKSNKTVTLKNVATDKVIKNVPWSKLDSDN